MDQDIKVFSSNVTRGQKPLNNDLYDLIDLIPAKPVTFSDNEKIFNDCNFQPKCDKQYVSKKKSKYKVKTVRDIRKMFEKDIYSELPKELEKQQNVLLRKIRAGHARENNTKTLAKNMIKCEIPISRPIWQMLMNLNPEEHVNFAQFVLWNGKYIQLTGSKGGKSKFICKHDLGNNKVPQKKQSFSKKMCPSTKKCLLKNSLTVKFKPGPLTRKRYLDDSFQKYHVGGIELVNLPKSGLDIQPSYGIALEPTISSFLHSLRDIDGIISRQWAEIAVSVLGSVKNNKAIQTRNDYITIDLKYKRNQSRILMRRDVDNIDNEKTVTFDNHSLNSVANEQSIIFIEVKSIMDDILRCVEISLEQDNMYTKDESSELFVEKEFTLDNQSYNTNAHAQLKETNHHTQIKDRTKRKFSELERLDVTVIRLPEHSSFRKEQSCQNPYCLLGCICSSLECSYQLKRHCGRTECMFECKCDFSQYKVVDSFESDCPELIPGLLNLDNEINLKLAKEEQRFHHTVVMSGEKSILLKSRKRNWKAPKKYADFYTKMSLKTKVNSLSEISIPVLKLNCENIEPWCMVHNLYKCFCKGKFTESSLHDIIMHEKNINETFAQQEVSKKNIFDVPSMVEKNLETKVRNIESHPKGNKNSINSILLNDFEDDLDQNVRNIRLHPKGNKNSLCLNDFEDGMDRNNDSCVRIRPYVGRKYSNGYYQNTHRKILEMEMNDKTLRRRMKSIIYATGLTESDNNFLEESSSDIIDISDKEVELVRSELSLIENMVHQPNLTIINPSSPCFPSKTKLIAWLDSNYRIYKQRINQGIMKLVLEPPKLGKIALHPWEFLLHRYKERKNLFLVSKQSPFRIFMAIDIKNSFFKNCINIDDIRFPDLHKYPPTVKNLLTNATDPKKNFYILCGLSHCWEIVGSITKLNKVSNKDKSLETSLRDNENENNTIDSSKEELINNKEGDNDEKSCFQKIDSDSSKWFVMTIENDFSEIQFYKRGFFVKYDTIIKAIYVARISGKSVRMSSQKCADHHNDPQFGIYAIPNANEYSVFVGPYEEHESLGIETVKTHSNVKNEKRTRGIWITSSKIDNLKIISNPLSFMPQQKVQYNEMLSLDEFIAKSCRNTELENDLENANNNRKEMCCNIIQMTPNKSMIKVIKPIKIRKTNGFYQLAPNGLLKPISPLKNQEQEKQISDTVTPILLNTSLTEDLNSTNICNALLLHTLPLIKTLDARGDTSSYMVTTKDNHKNQSKEPVAEITSYVTKNSKLSESNSLVMENESTGTVKGAKGMFILKPEEINKRIFENITSLSSESNDATSTNQSGMNIIDVDIENFLAQSVICMTPGNDTYLESDDGDFKSDSECKWKYVWIECKNVENLGWIRGRRNNENHISVEFPGFKFTEFHTEQEALDKINQVLLRRIYIPRNLILKWHVVESEDNLKSKYMLKLEDLDLLHFVVTKHGIKQKRYISVTLNTHKKVKLQQQRTSRKSSSTIDKESTNYITQEDDFKATSEILENEGIELWNNTLTKKDEILSTFHQADDNSRNEMTEQLKSMLSCNCL